MHSTKRLCFVFWMIVAAAPAPSMALAQESPAPAKAPEKLAEFKSKEGGFTVLLPGKPVYEKIEVDDAKKLQHQFVLGGPNGAYMISYQDNPNLEGATAETLAEALTLGRDAVQKAFGGKLVESEEIRLGEEHPGLAFRVTMPAAGGEARCRFYMVRTRLYQVTAIGLPAFVVSKEATQVLESVNLASE